MTFSKLTFANLPSNLGKAYDKLILVERLRDNANIDTLMGFFIVNAINSNTKSDTKILQQVKEAAITNREAMGLVIGEDLTNDIINIIL